MDSSDSENDCYGNIAQKLQSMKNNYTEDKIDSTNLLDDSAEIDEIVRKANDAAKLTVPLSETIQSENDADADSPSEVIIDSLLASSSKRVTRSAAKRQSSEGNVAESSAPKKAARKKSSATSSNACSVVDRRACEVTEHSPNNESLTSRGRGQGGSSRARAREVAERSPNNESLTSRGRGQGGRSRGRARGRSRNRNMRLWLPRNPSSDMNTNLPVYSVGNTDEYPDQSDNQALFCSKGKSDDIVVIDENDLDENEELSVKVYWQSSEFFKFTIRKFQKLSQIFDYFSKKESVSNDKLFFTFNDRILKPDDTPDSIGYSIVKFIDGGIINQSVSNIISDQGKQRVKGGIKLKFQCQYLKNPIEAVVSLDDKLSVAMMKCAESLETTVDKLKFEFDGDFISGKMTARELELEGGECIDVRMCS